MRWKCSSSQQPAFSAQYERSWRVLPVSGGVPGAIFERARLFCERAGIEPARVRVCRLSALPSFYAASMSPGSFSSSHVSSFRFTLIPPKTDLSSLSTFMTTCRSIARFSARSSRLARDLSSRRPAVEVFQQPTTSSAAANPSCRGASGASLPPPRDAPSDAPDCLFVRRHRAYAPMVLP